MGLSKEESEIVKLLKNTVIIREQPILESLRRSIPMKGLTPMKFQIRDLVVWEGFDFDRLAVVSGFQGLFNGETGYTILQYDGPRNAPSHHAVFEQTLRKATELDVKKLLRNKYWKAYYG